MTQDENNPQDSRNSMQENYKHIKGWGIDADRKNDPTYPIKSRTNEEQLGYSWERPPLQIQNVEVLHSNERPNVTATFGSPNPPSGLSGVLRRKAFKYSESSYGHWVPLIMADRVDMVEGVLNDLAHGHVPNIFAELGWSAEWKHNRKAFVTKAAIITAVTATLVLLATRKRHQAK
jgi:hypothetical protein